MLRVQCGVGIGSTHDGSDTRKPMETIVYMSLFVMTLSLGYRICVKLHKMGLSDSDGETRKPM
jgi:hypothetical protein